MKIITIIGYKGGVGKSTSAVHLATYFSEYGKTLLVDGDPNHTALGWSERGHLPFNVADQRQAMKLVAGADYVIIDTPARPNSDDLKELAKGCDLLILPTSPGVVSLQPMLDTARDLGEASYRALLTIVPTYPSREGEIMQADLKQARIPVFKSMIRRTVGFAKAAMQGRPICELSEATAQAAWQDYKSVGDEIRRLLK
ncbi:MAG: AAA family ATPase [Blastocatellia bacterium]